MGAKPTPRLKRKLPHGAHVPEGTAQPGLVAGGPFALTEAGVPGEAGGLGGSGTALVGLCHGPWREGRPPTQTPSFPSRSPPQGGEAPFVP